MPGAAHVSKPTLLYPRSAFHSSEQCSKQETVKHESPLKKDIYQAKMAAAPMRAPAMHHTSSRLMSKGTHMLPSSFNYPCAGQRHWHAHFPVARQPPAARRSTTSCRLVHYPRHTQPCSAHQPWAQPPRCTLTPTLWPKRARLATGRSASGGAWSATIGAAPSTTS